MGKDLETIWSNPLLKLLLTAGEALRHPGRPWASPGDTTTSLGCLCPCSATLKIKHLLNPSKNKTSVSPEQSHVLKGPLLCQLLNKQGKKKKGSSITSVPNVNEFFLFSRRQILSINIRITSEMLKFQRYKQQLCAVPPGVPMLPLVSVQWDDVGSAATAAGYNSWLTPVGGANVRAALVVTGRCDDAARRVAC